eukprot:20644-Heterococcus_DN1.PRE.2
MHSSYSCCKAALNVQRYAHHRCNSTIAAAACKWRDSDEPHGSRLYRSVPLNSTDSDSMYVQGKVRILIGAASGCIAAYSFTRSALVMLDSVLQLLRTQRVSVAATC